LKDVNVDASTRETMERAAPVHRKTWWWMHRAANRGYRAELTPHIARHRSAITYHAEIISIDGDPYRKREV
jgi:hypothetical protein